MFIIFLKSWNLSPEQFEKIKAKFDSLDLNKDGKSMCIFSRIIYSDIYYL
jgi:hypothetical protein